jgi:bifunctional non-homologous end joining protein LigD
LLLGYYTDDGRLLYAGRAGTGMTDKELKRLAGVLAPLNVPKMPLAEPPPRDSRFGSPLKLSKVHWVKPELHGQREDKPATQVVRAVPHPPRTRN